jgi:hypothetical protein
MTSRKLRIESSIYGFDFECEDWIQLKGSMVIEGFRFLNEGGWILLIVWNEENEIAMVVKKKKRNWDGEEEIWRIW